MKKLLQLVGAALLGCSLLMGPGYAGYWEYSEQTSAAYFFDSDSVTTSAATSGNASLTTTHGHSEGELIVGGPMSSGIDLVDYGSDSRSGSAGNYYVYAYSYSDGQAPATFLVTISW